MIKNILSFWTVLCISTLAYAQQTYYNDVNLNLTGIDLKEALATKIISTHTKFLAYSEIWNVSQITDINPNNPQEVLLIYGWEDGTDNDVTNNRTRGINDFGGSVGEWNREHVFSRSLGNPNLGEAGPGSDAHHLRPSDTQRNSSRSNEKFTEGSGVESLRTNGGWYPGDEWKGDVARMMMYMYVRYGERCLPTNVGIGNNSSTPDNMIDLFLKWNAEDPVSDIEKTRNEYHENTNNDFAQGNRNPFIDNPILATRIWGGQKAEDIWGIYTSSDTEAPTTPTNLNISNISTFSAEISWNPSTDNIAVTSYDVFVNGKLSKNTTKTSATIIDLESNSPYSIYVIAKDVAENKSEQSATINFSTIEDVIAPSVPTNIVISNETGTSFKITWDAATDNTKVTGYDIYINGTNTATTTEETYTATNLTTSTTYNVQVLAKDKVGNESQLSVSVFGTTTDGSTTTANELFFSEYIEGSSNNKALEIVNITNADVNLSSYSLKRQSNGGVDGKDWESPLQLSGTIKKGDVYVIINGSASIQKLINEADFVQPNASETNWGSPINFNGNDPMGLFKNDILIDIIGTYNGGSSNFAKDKTLRRKSGVSQPNTAFDIDNEWDILPKDTADGFGSHNISLNIQRLELSNIKLFPNPVENQIQIINSENLNVQNLKIYNLLGRKMVSLETPKKEINVAFLSKGIYILKFEVENKLYSTKFIKK